MALNGFDGIGAFGGNLGILGMGLNGANIGLGGINLGCCIDPCNQINLNIPACEIAQSCDLPQMCDAQPIIVNQDIPVPRPVVVRKQTVPIPFLPYCRRTKRGYPKW
ncbi:hypothetical protein BpHYR1_008155 [Brachionus plicatilis]|uniref:Uncharacterized protein n=1 Tax=Brachionus plicatilis TaxID=10195 RepID=A0A3M7PS65_BRAPC|nr:hypothetical protein BpHYR1_008155 [Brachionus plicatilis]